MGLIICNYYSSIISLPSSARLPTSVASSLRGRSPGVRASPGAAGPAGVARWRRRAWQRTVPSHATAPPTQNDPTISEKPAGPLFNRETPHFRPIKSAYYRCCRSIVKAAAGERHQHIPEHHDTGGLSNAVSDRAWTLFRNHPTVLHTASSYTGKAFSTLSSPKMIPLC